MGISSQRKGRAGEIELAKALQSFGIPARPGDPASYGNCPDLVGVPGVHVECKRVERLNLDAAMTQAAFDSVRFGGLPAVFHRRDKGKWLVTMRLTDWAELHKAYERVTLKSGFNF